MSYARVIILTALATLVTILASGCSDSGSGIVPSDDTQSPIVLTVQPDSGRVGSLVSIRGTQFLAGGRYFVAFRGADEELLADSSTESTIYSGSSPNRVGKKKPIK